MKSLIKKILKESEFDWVDKIIPIELGKFFDSSDVSYDDDDAKIYLGEQGSVTYNLTEEEFFEYCYDNVDDWVLATLIHHNGDYDGSYDESELDWDEVNYLGHALDNNQKERLQYILDYYSSTRDKEKIDLEHVIDDDSFSKLEGPLLNLYRGVGDWDDACTDSVSAMSIALSTNRWNNVGVVYKSILVGNNLTIFSNNYDEITIKLNVPYKNHTDLSEILTITGLYDYNWGEMFYEEWDVTGSDEYVEEAINTLLDNLEGAIDEETSVK